MKKDKKPTVGEHALRLQEKYDNKVNPIELQREMLKGNESEESYENQVRIAVNRGKKLFSGKNFFVVVLHKRERLLKNVIRLYYFPRQSCPRTEYDQTVYHYFPKEEKLDLIWTIPSLQAVQEIFQNKHLMSSEFKELIDYVVRFKNGSLDQLSERLNLKIVA